MKLDARPLLIAALVLASLPALAETLKESSDKTYKVQPGSSLVVSNVNGNVAISGWDRPEVRIIAEKQASGDRDDARQALNKIKIDVQQVTGTLRVTTVLPKNNDSIWNWLGGDHVSASVSYKLHVPRNLNLAIETVNGNVAVAGVSGTLELETTNGGISAKGTGGAINAETTNGNIDAEMLTVAGGRPMNLETTNGRIDVLLPSTIKADVSARTTNGKIHSDLPITVAGTIGKNSLTGTLNGGGPDLILRTTNGGIQIRKGN